MKKIECRYCGWSWDESDGGDDKYLCHMCNNDNSRFYDKIFESEQPKKKLFIPRKLSGEDSRWADWNKEQPIKDGVRINQYDINTGKEEGYWEYYHDNGQLWSKGSYKNGDRDGIWEGYYDNGQLDYKGSYKNGLRYGYWEEYWSNGQLWYKGSYKNGEKDGIWEEYYYNGQLLYKGSYKNGKEEGIWKWYHDNGQLMSKGSYKNGELIKNINEAETPKKKLFIPRKLSGEDSRWSDWNKEQPIVDGLRINQYDINTGKEEGYWEGYHSNGKLWSKGSYKNGVVEGYWKYYHDNGQLMSKGLHKNGFRDGYWEEYDTDGKLWFKGSFKNGDRDGIIEYYDTDGRLDFKGLYKNDELVKRIPLTESERPKNKLFIPRRVDERWDDFLKSMITTDYNIESYLNRKNSYKDYSKNINPLVMKLPKGDLITFVKANPFWLDSLDKVKYLFKTLNYNENKEIAENHIGQTFAKGSFYTTSELKYYENKFKIPKNSKIDTYVFIGSDEFVEAGGGKYKKMFDIERLMKVSADNWKDISDYGFGGMILMMRLRASANNKGLYKITANKGLLDEYEGKTGSEMPDYILSAINQKKEKF